MLHVFLTGTGTLEGRDDVQRSAQRVWKINRGVTSRKWQHQISAYCGGLLRKTKGNAVGANGIMCTRRFIALVVVTG
jgi:hypothetical protein